jgi:hypothetical protein
MDYKKGGFGKFTTIDTNLFKKDVLFNELKKINDSLENNKQEQILLKKIIYCDKLNINDDDKQTNLNNQIKHLLYNEHEHDTDPIEDFDEKMIY